MEPKKLATDWQIRCTRCDFSEPWDKPVTRARSGKPKFIFGRCPNCKRIRLRVIEPVSELKAPVA